MDQPRAGQTPRFRAAAWRTFAIVLILDLGGGASVLLVWSYLFGLADLGFSLVIFSVRGLAVYAYLGTLLAPIHRYASARVSGQAPSDELVLAIDDQLQRLFTRFARAMMLGWTLAMSLTLLPAFGLLGDRALASAELFAACLIVLGCAATPPVILFSPLREALRPVQFEISHRLLERGLVPRRPRSSAANQVTYVLFGSLAVVLVVGNAVGTLLHARNLRAVTQAEQLHRVEVLASELERGGPGTRPLDTGLTLVQTLPPLLLGEGASEVEGGRVAFDARTETVVAAAPVAGQGWVLAEVESDEQLGQAIVFVIVLLGVSLPPCFINAHFLGRSIGASAGELDDRVRDLIAHGRLSRVARIAPMHDDEFGALATTFNGMVDAFEALAVAAHAVAEGKLDTPIELPGELPDAFRAMLGRLREVVDQIRSTSVELSTAASELLAATAAQSSLAQTQANKIAVVGERTASLAASTGQVTAAAAAVRDDAELSVERARLTATRMSELEGQTRGINELLVEIHAIADRSDLLALNGALEAVRAGEQGRGFGLVAAEMRRLAERVGATAELIGDRVVSIEQASHDTHAAVAESHALAARTAVASQEINGVLLDQSSEIERSARVAGEASAIIDELARASGQTRDIATHLREYAGQLEHLLGQFEL